MGCNGERLVWWFCGRHLIGFLIFLGLTIYTATHLPTIEPTTFQRWQAGIMESLPSYLQLPEALSSCVPGTYDGTQCIQVSTHWKDFVVLGFHLRLVLELYQSFVYMNS